MNLSRKYRPIDFSGFKGNKKIVDDIESLLRVGDMPHLMFVGPPGCGKTTMELIVARKYLGRPITLNTGDGDADFFALNASDENGVDVIRDVVKEKARTRSSTFDDQGILKKRICALREADKLTPEAQHALRDIVERNEKNCIFIFSLNHIEGIKEPALISRCATWFFKRPTDEDCAELFLEIAEKEEVELENNDMALDIAKYYKGDLRHILNDCLEALRGYPNPITKETVWKVYEQNNKSVAERVYKSNEPRKKFFEIYRTESFDVRKFLEDYYELLNNNSLELAKAFAKVDARLRMYASEVVQINYLFSLLESSKI